MNISKSLKNLFRLLILTAAVTILALPRAHAILNISKYDGLADLEADFDREVEELQVILESQPNGNLEHIGLSHLRNIVSARHLDFFFSRYTDGLSAGRKSNFIGRSTKSSPNMMID